MKDSLKIQDQYLIKVENQLKTSISKEKIKIH